MLEGLTDIPWARLEHAYGSAADVPDLIRALGSPDPEERERAGWTLYSNIFHQGTRYEASAYAVPFLLELLAERTTPDRGSILALLASLAIGYDESWLPRGFPVAEYRQRAVGGGQVLLAAPPLDLDPQMEDVAPSVGGLQEQPIDRYAYWESLDQDRQSRLFAHIELAVYDAVRSGVPLFRQMLASDDPGTRVAAAYTLGWFPEEAEQSWPALVAMATSDPEPAVSAVALVAVGLLKVADPSVLGVAHAALSDPRPVVRWASAVALANLRGAAADPRVLEQLLAWSSGDSHRRDDIPYHEGDLAGYAALALRQCGDSHADAIFDALLSRVPSVSGPEALPVVSEALTWAFPEGAMVRGTPFDALDDRQRRLLRSLAESPQAWRWGDLGFGNFSLLISQYGLPHDVDLMRSYVG